MKKLLSLSLAVVLTLGVGTTTVYANSHSWFNVEVNEAVLHGPASRDLDLRNLPTWEIITVADGVDADPSEILRELKAYNERVVNATRLASGINARNSSSVRLDDSDSQRLGAGTASVSFVDWADRNIGFWSTTITYTGSSVAAWEVTGRTLDSLILNDAVSFHGASVSITATPSGASVSGSASVRTVNMNNSFGARNTGSHRISNLRAESSLALSHVSKSTSAAFRTGSDARTLFAQDTGWFS